MKKLIFTAVAFFSMLPHANASAYSSCVERIAPITGGYGNFAEACEKHPTESFVECVEQLAIPIGGLDALARCEKIASGDEQ